MSTVGDRIGWTPDMIGLDIKVRSLSKFERYQGDRVNIYSMWIGGLDIAAIASYLRGKMDDAREYARRAMVLANEYFAYEWPAEALAKVAAGTHGIDWADEFAAALRWGPPLAMWDALTLVASGVGSMDRRPDIGSSRGEHAIYLAFAACLRGDPSDVTVGWCRRAADEKDAVAAALGRAMNFLEVGDAAGCSDHLNDHLRLLRRSRAHKEDIGRAVSVGGTFLFHFARRRGVPVELDPSLADYVVRL